MITNRICMFQPLLFHKTWDKNYFSCNLKLKSEKWQMFSSVQFSHSVRSNSVTPWSAPWQASLPIINFCSLLKLMSTESVMPSNHLILCRPLLPPSIFPSIRVFSFFFFLRVFSNESALSIRCPKYWSFASTSVFPMNTQDWFPLGWTGWTSLQSKELSRVFSNTIVQKHQLFSSQLSLWSNSHIHTWLLEKP